MAIDIIDQDVCTGCGICVDSCSVDVIRMDEGSQTAQIRYPEDCMVCELCALDCPEQAITVSPDKESPLVVSWG